METHRSAAPQPARLPAESSLAEVEPVSVKTWLERSRTGALVAMALGAVVAIGWTVLPANSVAADDRPTVETVAAAAAAATAPTPVGLPAFADIIARVKPAVVTITIESAASGKMGIPSGPGGVPLQEYFERFFGPGGPGGQGGPGMPSPGPRRGGVGSGFVIDPGGLIVTNNHVVNEGDVITVTFDDGTELPATVVGTDPATDLAVIKVNATKPLPAVAFGDSDGTRIGDWVVAIGNPFGFGGTATVGIVSARGRDLRAGPYDDFLQIDAAINSGNSGGPVFDTTGRVIGVNTAIFSPNGGNVGIGFAIPAAQARNVVAQLRDGGAVRRGWLGVNIQPVNEEIASSLGLDKPAGALVVDVLSGGPAERAGVRAGDVVLKFGNQPIEDAGDLSRQVAAAKEGEEIVLTVLRDGTQRRIEVDIGDQAGGLARAGVPQPDPSRGMPNAATEGELGLLLAPLDPTTRERLGLGAGTEGLVVRRVDPRGRAADRLRAGDVIVMVNQSPVRGPDTLNAAVAQARRDKRSAVSVLVLRGNTKQFIAIPVG